MKKLFLLVVIVAGSLQACVKQNNVKVMGVILKSNIWIRKDIGVAD